MGENRGVRATGISRELSQRILAEVTPGKAPCFGKRRAEPRLALRGKEEGMPDQLFDSLSFIVFQKH